MLAVVSTLNCARIKSSSLCLTGKLTAPLASLENVGLCSYLQISDTCLSCGVINCNRILLLLLVLLVLLLCLLVSFTAGESHGDRLEIFFSYVAYFQWIVPIDWLEIFFSCRITTRSYVAYFQWIVPCVRRYWLLQYWLVVVVGQGFNTHLQFQ